MAKKTKKNKNGRGFLTIILILSVLIFGGVFFINLKIKAAIAGFTDGIVSIDSEIQGNDDINENQSGLDDNDGMLLVDENGHVREEDADLGDYAYDPSMPKGDDWRNQSLDAITSETNADDSQNNEPSISLPYSIPESNLVANGLGGYNGYFLEDGSDSEISGVAALVVTNTGSTAVEYAMINIDCGDSMLTFEISDLAARTTVVAQEVNRAGFSGESIKSCSATVAEIPALEMASGKIKVEENSDGALVVTNLTKKAIPCVRVFYKFYMPDQKAYIGGITYTAKVTDLSPNSSETLQPSHYSPGSSKVVMVRTYDTKE